MTEFGESQEQAEVVDDAMSSLRNELSGMVRGSSVQARDIFGGVRFHIDDPARLPIPNQLPSWPATFTDRQSELTGLQRLLDAQGATAGMVIVVVIGVGGVGKTSLAVRWLDLVRERFPAGQLFADLGGFSGDVPARPSEVLGRFVRALGVPAERVPFDLGERAALFRSLTAGRALALLLDDAVSAAQVRAMLPGSGPSVVVVTTRRQIGGLAIDGAHFVELAPLPEEAAVELLDRVAGAGRAAADPHSARMLVGLCGRLPIAVCASGARLAPRPRWTISRVVEELANEHDRLAALSRSDDISVRAVFDMSYQALPHAAARMYRLLGLLPGHDFGVSVAAAVAGVELGEALDLLEVLVEASLLEETTDRGYRFHDLVRVHARTQAQAESPEERQAAVERSIDWYLRAAVAADLVVLPQRWRLGGYYRNPPTPPLPLDSPAGALDWLETELPNLLGALRLAADHRMYEAGWQLCEALWGLFLTRKHYDAWIASHETGLACARACADPRAEARLHSQLGSAHRSLGRLDEAIDHFRQALRLDQTAEHRLGEASALDQLGLAYLRLGRYNEAISYFTQSLAIHEELDRPRGVALMHLNIGQALSESGRYTEAVERLQTAARQAAAVPEPYHQARALAILGETYIRVGRPHDAAQPLQQALTILEERGATYDQAHVHTHLANLAELLGEADAVRTYLERALALFTRVGARQATDVQARLDAMDPPPSSPATRSGEDGT